MVARNLYFLEAILESHIVAQEMVDYFPFQIKV
jgi:hypothetical protein